jgi:hypothetical protein
MVREPVDIEILSWEFDEENTEHLARHDVAPEDVLSVWSGSPAFFVNLPDRSGTHIMVGEDSRARWLYIAILETSVHGCWRSITGWQSRIARRLAVNKGGSE